MVQIGTMRAMNTTPELTIPTEQDHRSAVPRGHDWQDAGDAWGSRSADWACLFEHYATDVIMAIFDQMDVGQDTSLLDIACGSGLAVRMAKAAGANPSGIDAAENLIAIAQDRTPDADVRLGDMFALPWEDESFDVITSINGIWGECEAALAEAYRVLRPGGSIAISFWGKGHLDLKPCFMTFAFNSPAAHVDGMRRTAGIGRPGVAEDMLTSVGFDVTLRDGRTSVLEWPDADTAWRAVASVGPAVPALKEVGASALRTEIMKVLEPLRDSHGIYRFRNDLQYVIATKP